jgi:hypothetical protein
MAAQPFRCHDGFGCAARAIGVRGEARAGRSGGCGVCHTNLGSYNYGVRTNHALPLSLGHEISGHVVVTIRGRVDRQRFALKAARLDYAARVRAKLAAVERLYLDELMKSRDALEGLQAFIAKRPAQWERC